MLDTTAQVQLGQAWWSYEAQDHAFTVSPAWEQLTGYDASDYFPELNSAIPVEQLLDNFVDRWVELVADSDKAKAKRAAERFLLEGLGDSVFKLDYLLKCADGTEKLVLSQGVSKWDGGRLQSIFVTVQDIDHLRDRNGAAAAIAETQQQVNKAQAALDSLKANLGTISTISALGLAALVSFNNFLEGAIKELRRTWSMIGVDITTSEIDADLFELDPKVRDAAERKIILAAPPGISVIKVVAYSVGQFPSEFQPIVEVNYDQAAPDSWLVRTTDSTVKIGRAHV